MVLKISLKNTCLTPFWGILGCQSWRMLCDLADLVHMSGTIEVLLTPASVKILVMGQWGMLHNHWSGKNKLIKKGRHHTNSSLKIIFFKLKYKTLTGKVVGLLWRDASFCFFFMWAVWKIWEQRNLTMQIGWLAKDYKIKQYQNSFWFHCKMVSSTFCPFYLVSYLKVYQ